MTICSLCGGTLRVTADVTDPAIIDEILSHIYPLRATIGAKPGPSHFPPESPQADTFLSTQNAL